MRTPRARVLVLPALLTASACAPVVAHGPRVSPGVTIGADASASAGPEYIDGGRGREPFLYPPVGVNVGYGFRGANPDGAALRLGLHVPIPLVLAVQGDAYLQLPTRGAVAGGVGVTVDGSQSMPYAQIGYVPDRGLGVYATQGHTFIWNRADRQVNANATWGRMWLTTVAAQYRADRVTTHLFVTTGKGQRIGYCVDGGPRGTQSCEPNEPRRVLHTGLMLEWRLRK